MKFLLYFSVIVVLFLFSRALRLQISQQSGIRLTKGKYVLLERNSIALRPSDQKIVLVGDIFTNETCLKLIEAAENVAKTREGGWTKTRHKAYPTTDLPLEEVLGPFNSIEGQINAILLPQLAAIFQLNENHVKIGELFVCKYTGSQDDTGGQHSLKFHTDGTPYSFVLALNNEFEGGGTYFPSTQQTYLAPTGGAYVFCGKQFHGGHETRRGNRFILTGFITYFDPKNPEKLFLDDYNREFDGTACSSGVRTGDQIEFLYDINGEKLLLPNEGSTEKFVCEWIQRCQSVQVPLEVDLVRLDDDESIKVRAEAPRLLATGQFINFP